MERREVRKKRRTQQNNYKQTILILTSTGEKVPLKMNYMSFDTVTQPVDRTPPSPLVQPGETVFFLCFFCFVLFLFVSFVLFVCLVVVDASDGGDGGDGGGGGGVGVVVVVIVCCYCCLCGKEENITTVI